MKTIYENAKVYTGELPLAEAFVVEDGKFLFAGSKEEAHLIAGTDCETVDLGGNFVCSGFIDSHMHLLSYGNMLRTARLAEHTESLSGMLSYMKRFLDDHPVSDGEWFYGRGWNHDYFTDEKRMPERFDLDKVSDMVPICAVRACGHCLVVNSKALELLGLDETVIQPDGGSIGFTNGKLNGLFFDNAMDIVYNAMPPLGLREVMDRIREACKALNAYGVTGSQTDDYCFSRRIPWQTINEAYRRLKESGELTVRIYQQSNFTSLKEYKEFVEAGNKTGIGDDLFRIGPLKMLGDGALGSRTAFLSRPYADDPTTCGFPVFSQETMDKMVDYANENDQQIAIHTIGDACLDMVLNSYEKALLRHPRKDHRLGIVHCQISRPDQLEKIKKLGLHVYAQSIFLDYDNHIVEQRVGKELASTSYNWKTLMKNGVSVSNGTDCPVELPNVMACMQCAVTRTTLHDNVGPYLPNQAFTVKEALDSYTCRSAEASFDENVKGRIREGMIADFVVLGEDPFEVDQNAIKDIPILATYLGGKKVYSSDYLE